MSDATGSKSNVLELTVSELSADIKKTVEGAFGYVRLRGEISGYRGPHSSGHCYFSIKDERARIEAVVWKGVFQKLRHKPEEGLEVVATGRVTTYPGSSKYQIVIEALEPAGVGALLAQLEKLKKTLAAEGLFDETRKRSLPFLPGVIGIITSPTGAVIRDMLAGFTERFPSRVIIWPVRVQGETSGPEVAAAIEGFNALASGGAVPRPDLLIVARGGGSLEDLWGFNHEAVARSAAASDIPLISAVGHETDWTLIDLVADARAPTPTKAAEWAVPVWSELLERSADLGRRLEIGLRRGQEARQAALRAASRGLPRLAELLALPRQRFDGAAGRLSRALIANTRTHRSGLERLSGRLQPRLLGERAKAGRQRLGAAAHGLEHAYTQAAQRYRARLDAQARLLLSVSYHGVLERGFALIRDDEGQMVRRKEALSPGSVVDIEFADGRIGAAIGGKPKSGPKRKPKATPQGSLF